MKEPKYKVTYTSNSNFSGRSKRRTSRSLHKIQVQQFINIIKATEEPTNITVTTQVDVTEQFKT